MPVPLMTVLPAPRPMTAMVLTFHLWKPPARLHHPAPRLPVQPVRASGCFTGQAAPPPLNNRECLSPLQAWSPCSSFSTRRTQRAIDPLKTCPPYVSPPLALTQRKRMTSQIPLPPRTAPTSPSPSLPPTRRMLHR